LGKRYLCCFLQQHLEEEELKQKQQQQMSKMPISNSKETIDERVLRLLGLEDVFDLDYDTYHNSSEGGDGKG
jgi:hypothetical protein